MLNVKFNVGQVAKEMITVVVVNPTPYYMYFQKVIDDKGNVSYQPSINMVKVMKVWNNSDRPTYLDLTTDENNRYGNECKY